MANASKGEGRLEQKCLDFAGRMVRIPRKALRCDIYGTVSAVVDRGHALNILRKVVDPTVTPQVAYSALCLLQDRLDGQGAA